MHDAVEFGYAEHEPIAHAPGSDCMSVFRKAQLIVHPFVSTTQPHPHACAKTFAETTAPLQGVKYLYWIRFFTKIGVALSK